MCAQSESRPRSSGAVLTASPIGRRSLLAGSVGAAGLFALGAAASGGSGTLIRPPGAADPQAFLSRCLRCDRCRSVCPTGVIGVGGFSDGLAVMRTPVMNYRHGYCDFCRKCAEVCPPGAILDFDPETETVGLAEITEACIALRTGACTKCHEACPYDAVMLDAQNRPIIDADRCNGCGKCELICPASVFQAYKRGMEKGVVVRPLKKGGAL